MVSEFEEAINLPGVEAVFVCSPTDTHVDYVVRSVEAGKYVFCEKPVDLDLGRAKACVQQLGDRATQVMMGFNRRFDPSLAAIRQAVRARRYWYSGTNCGHITRSSSAASALCKSVGRNLSRHDHS